MKTATTQSFSADVLSSDLPVLVDFWAPWCGPCKSIAPLLEDIAQEYQGRINVVKVNIDEESDVAIQYNVRGIPSLLLFKSGEVVATKVGAMPKSAITAFLDTNS